MLAAGRRQKAPDASVGSHWSAVRSCVVFYCIYLGSILPLAWISAENQATAQLVIGGADMFVVLAAIWLTRVQLRPLLRFDWDVVQYSLIGVILLVPLMMLNFGFHGMLAELMGLEGTGMLDPFADAGYAPWVAIVAICVMPGIWEEVAFRGLIQTQLQRAVGAREAIVLSALLFAVIHLSFFSGVYLFLLGLVLGYLCHRSRSLIPGMVLHFVHNLIVVVDEWIAM